MSILLWCLNSTVLGSSKVALSVIKAFIHNGTSFTVICSRGGAIHDFLLSTKQPHVSVVCLPKFLRLYPLLFLLKLSLPLDLFFYYTIVFDDYPFKCVRRQLLYCQQFLLLTRPARGFQLFRNIAFRLLLNNFIVFFCQSDYYSHRLSSLYNISHSSIYSRFHVF